MDRKLLMPERPSVKMAYYGPKALSNAELLSCIIGSGTKDRSSLEIADDIISYVSDNVGDLGTAEVAELSEVYGVGSAKASAVVAAMELGKRMNAPIPTDKVRIRSAADVAGLLMSQLRSEQKEHFVSLLLNSKCELISQRTISIGNLDSAPVHPREVFSPAVRRGAAAIIVAHNHPSGDPTPSPQDIDVTKRLFEASKILGIKLFDHVIIGNHAFTSIKAEGYLDGWE